MYIRVYAFLYRGEAIPGRTYSDSLISAFAMASDSSKWDIKMLLRMITNRRFNPKDVTFPNADALLAEITSIVQQVSKYIRLYTAIYVYESIIAALHV